MDLVEIVTSIGRYKVVENIMTSAFSDCSQCDFPCGHLSDTGFRCPLQGFNNFEHHYFVNEDI